jgi:hypothetical protein
LARHGVMCLRSGEGGLSCHNHCEILYEILGNILLSSKCRMTRGFKMNDEESQVGVEVHYK